MKKLFSSALLATLMFGLSSFAMAKDKKGAAVRGKVTAVTATSVTVQPGKKVGGESQTITVPEGTPITAKDGSTAPALSDLVGKRVQVKESQPGTASAIVVGKGKKDKKKNA